MASARCLFYILFLLPLVDLSFASLHRLVLPATVASFPLSFAPSFLNRCLHLISFHRSVWLLPWPVDSAFSVPFVFRLSVFLSFPLPLYSVKLLHLLRPVCVLCLVPSPLDLSSSLFPSSLPGSSLVWCPSPPDGIEVGHLLKHTRGKGVQLFLFFTPLPCQFSVRPFFVPCLSLLGLMTRVGLVYCDAIPLPYPFALCSMGFPPLPLPPFFV